LAFGQYYYACLKDYDTAVRYFEQARRLMPNSSRVPQALAYVARRQGQWDRSDSYFNEAERLDPRNLKVMTEHAALYESRRQFPEALRKSDQILNIAPDDPNTLMSQAGIAQAQGDLSRASALLARLRPSASDTSVMFAEAYQSILERRPMKITAFLSETLATRDPTAANFAGELRFWVGWAERVVGDHSAAEQNWRQGRTELELLLQNQPENDILMGYLALTNMALGNKAEALSLAKRAMEMNPIEKDAISGPGALEVFARVAAQTGEHKDAIAALQKLLSIPYSGPVDVPLTPALLRLDPMFDPLRNDRAFQKLASSTTK
jgi:serine/threonine-protein kinase